MDEQATDYGANRAPFDGVVFEDEKALEAGLRLKRRLKKLAGAAVGFVLGMTSSYCASWLWDRFPLSKHAVAAKPYCPYVQLGRPVPMSIDEVTLQPIRYLAKGAAP